MAVRWYRARWIGMAAAVAISAPLIALAGTASGTPRANASHHELEMDISGNGSNMNVGEPEIAINPRNPEQLWADGATFPVPLVLSGSTPVPDTCQGWSSDNGGLSWQPAPLPQDEQFAKGAPSVCGEDGVAAFGPDGTLYAGGDTATSTTVTGTAPCAAGSIDEEGVCILVQGFDAVLVSKDGGHTWSTPVYTMGSASLGNFTFSGGNPINTFDRPWLAVDRSTNTLYAMGHNIADHEPFVTASTDEAKTFGTIYAVDSPAYPSGGEFGSTMAAAHGTLAVAYAATAAPGATCPCVVFEISTDHGATFTRHVVPTVDASSQPFPYLAADPKAPGHFALTVLNSAGTQNQVYTTSDYGRTWQGPVLVAEAPATNQQFKPWLAYAPSGQLLLVWRTWHGTPGTAPYDVWLAVGGVDGRRGAVFGSPVRVSSVAAAYPPPGLGAGQYSQGDDFSWVIANKKYVYVGWGDSRDATGPYAEGAGVQMWIGRLPLNSFSGRNE